MTARIARPTVSTPPHGIRIDGVLEVRTRGSPPCTETLRPLLWESPASLPRRSKAAMHRPRIGATGGYSSGNRDARQTGLRGPDLPREEWAMPPDGSLA